MNNRDAGNGGLQHMMADLHHDVDGSQGLRAPRLPATNGVEIASTTSRDQQIPIQTSVGTNLYTTATPNNLGYPKLTTARSVTAFPTQFVPNETATEVPHLSLERLCQAFVSVVTRHGNNSMDPMWLKARDYLVMAWFDVAPTSSPAAPIRPPVRPPTAFAIASPNTATIATVSRPPTGPVGTPAPVRALPFPWKPATKDIVNILQGRVFVLSLHNIPAVGLVTITIRNLGGALHSEDVTDNFVTTRVIRNDTQGAGSKVQWKLRSEYATSKLPYVRKQINQMDKQTVHAIEFTLSVSGQPDVHLAWKKFLLVLGRGSSGEHEIAKTSDVMWEELEPMKSNNVPTLASAPISSASKRREKDPMEMEVEARLGKRKRQMERELLLESDSKKRRDDDDLMGGDTDDEGREEKGEKEKEKEKGKEKEEEEEEKEEDEFNEKATAIVKEEKLTDIRKAMGEALMRADGPSTLTADSVSPTPTTTTTTTTTTAATQAASDGDIDRETGDGKEPFETFTLQPQRPAPAQPPRPVVATPARAIAPAVSNAVPPAAPTANAANAASRPESLHLSIRLIEMAGKTPIAWGSMVPHNTELAIAMHNPSDDRIRVVCHVCDKAEKRLPMDGKLVMDLTPRESSVMCKFRALSTDGPIQLHFLAAALPLVPGRPLYHTRLFVNVAPPPPVKVG